MQVHTIFSVSVVHRDEVHFYGDHFQFSLWYKVFDNGVEVATPAPDINMFVLRHLRASGQYMCDIYPLTTIWELVNLAPIFRQAMSQCLSCNNSLEIPTTFYLNSFGDKETFHSILMYQ